MVKCVCIIEVDSRILKIVILPLANSIGYGNVCSRVWIRIFTAGTGRRNWCKMQIELEIEKEERFRGKTEREGEGGNDWCFFLSEIEIR